MPQLTLFANFAKRENSTKRPGAGGFALDVALKEGTSLSRPTFLLNRWPDTPLPSAVNYALFAGRYYYIDDVTWTTAHMYEISCHVDVLATYRDMIASYNTFVERAASDYNIMIPDAAISQSDRVISEGDIIFNNESEGSTLPPFDDVGCFILRTVSDEGINGYVMSWQGVRNMAKFLFTDATYPADMLADAVVKSFFNPFQYIIDLKWYPLSIDYFDHGQAYTDIGWGWWASSDIKGFTLGAGALGIEGEANLTPPTNIYNDFRLYTNGFVDYSLYLPGVGVVPLSPDVFAGEHVRIECSIDYKTGNIDWNIVDVKGYGTSNQEHVKIATFRGQIGIPQQLGQLNNDIFGNVMQGVSSVVSGLTGNIIGGVASGYNAVKQSLTPQASINGSNGNMMQIMKWPYPTLTYKIYESAGIPQNEYGRPLYQNRQLGRLSGYVKCGNASINIPGFAGEREQVNSYLNGGFYME